MMTHVFGNNMDPNSAAAAAGTLLLRMQPLNGSMPTQNGTSSQFTATTAVNYCPVDASACGMQQLPTILQSTAMPTVKPATPLETTATPPSHSNIAMPAEIHVMPDQAYVMPNQTYAVPCQAYLMPNGTTEAMNPYAMPTQSNSVPEQAHNTSGPPTTMPSQFYTVPSPFYAMPGGQSYTMQLTPEQGASQSFALSIGQLPPAVSSVHSDTVSSLGSNLSSRSKTSTETATSSSSSLVLSNNLDGCNVKDANRFYVRNFAGECPARPMTFRNIFDHSAMPMNAHKRQSAFKDIYVSKSKKKKNTKSNQPNRRYLKKLASRLSMHVAKDSLTTISRATQTRRMPKVRRYPNFKRAKHADIVFLHSNAPGLKACMTDVYNAHRRNTRLGDRTKSYAMGLGSTAPEGALPSKHQLKSILKQNKGNNFAYALVPITREMVNMFDRTIDRGFNCAGGRKKLQIANRPRRISSGLDDETNSSLDSKVFPKRAPSDLVRRSKSTSKLEGCTCNGIQKQQKLATSGSSGTLSNSFTSTSTTVSSDSVSLKSLAVDENQLRHASCQCSTTSGTNATSTSSESAFRLPGNVANSDECTCKDVASCCKICKSHKNGKGSKEFTQRVEQKGTKGAQKTCEKQKTLRKLCQNVSGQCSTLDDTNACKSSSTVPLPETISNSLCFCKKCATCCEKYRSPRDSKETGWSRYDVSQESITKIGEDGKHVARNVISTSKKSWCNSSPLVPFSNTNRASVFDLRKCPRYPPFCNFSCDSQYLPLSYCFACPTECCISCPLI